MKKFFTLYGWAIRIIAAALLIGLALFLKFGDGEAIVVPFIGLVIIIYSIVRLVPFIKTQKSDIIKTINIIEITLSLIVGAILILGTLFTEDGLGVYFGYLLGGSLLLRGSVHFYGLSEGGENGDLPSYFFHIAALIAGTYVIMTGDFTPGVLINLILVLSLGAGGYLGFESYRGYNVYRQRKQLEENAYDQDKDQPIDKDIPRKEDPEKDRDRIVS